MQITLLLRALASHAHTVLVLSISFNASVYTECTNGTKGSVPELCVGSVEGGPDTLQTVRDLVSAGTPVVLVASSGGVSELPTFSRSPSATLASSV